MSDPRPNSPEDVGFTHQRARRARPAPKADLEVLQTLGPAFEGVRATGDDLGRFYVMLRRKNGIGIGIYGATEAEALSHARRFVDAGGMAP